MVSGKDGSKRSYQQAISSKAAKVTEASHHANGRIEGRDGGKRKDQAQDVDDRVASSQTPTNHNVHESHVNYINNHGGNNGENDYNYVDGFTPTPKRQRSSTNWTVLATGSSDIAAAAAAAAAAALQSSPTAQVSTQKKQGSRSPSNPRHRREHQQQRRRKEGQQNFQQRLRAARFHEASMHDRPSDVPPSLYTRFHPQEELLGTNMGHGLGQEQRGMDLATDRLMEEYHFGHRSRQRGDSLSLESALSHGIGHPSTVQMSMAHANHTSLALVGESMSPNKAAVSASLMHDMTEADASTTQGHHSLQNKPSGLFRFGKTVASTFNPVQIWQRVSTNWKEAKEEVFREEQEAYERKEAERALREQRRIKAEEEYAALKKGGRLGALGTQNLQEGKKIYAPGYTQGTDVSTIQNEEPRVAGKGIIDESLMSTDPSTRRESVNKEPSKPQAFAQTTTSSMNVMNQALQQKNTSSHSRKSSFIDLRKVQSELHMRTKRKSARESLSPVKAEQPYDPNTKHVIPSNDNSSRALRKAHSKRDLAKQQRLNKRVSNLEMKLAEARRELQEAMADTELSSGAPMEKPTQGTKVGVQLVPDVTPASALSAKTTVASASLLSNSPVAGATATPAVTELVSPPKKLFVSGTLPTLPSERLLFPEQLEQLPSDGSKGSDETVDMPVPSIETEQEPTENMGNTAEKDHASVIAFHEIISDETVEAAESVDNVRSPDLWTQEATTPAALRKQRSRNTIAINRKRKSTTDQVDALSSLANTDADEGKDEVYELQSPYAKRSPRKKAATANLREASLQKPGQRIQNTLKNNINAGTSSPRQMLKPIAERSSNERSVTKSPNLRPSSSLIFNISGSYNRVVKNKNNSTDENEPWEEYGNSPISPVKKTKSAEALPLSPLTLATKTKTKRIALASVPTKPTATATPAHPGFITIGNGGIGSGGVDASTTPISSPPAQLKKRASSSSSSLILSPPKKVVISSSSARSPVKRVARLPVVSGDTGRMKKGVTSPAPSVSTFWRESGAVGGIGVEEVTAVGMEKKGRGADVKQKEHWEWPDDVF